MIYSIALPKFTFLQYKYYSNWSIFNIYTHPSDTFSYVPHGFTFKPNLSLGASLLQPLPTKLKPSSSKRFIISCQNCNGLETSIPSITNYLDNSNTDILVLLETKTRPGKKPFTPILSLVNTPKGDHPSTGPYWYGTAVYLNPKF